jgi:hypothetical protein
VGAGRVGIGVGLGVSAGGGAAGTGVGVGVPVFLTLFVTKRRAGGKIHGTRSTIDFVVHGKARSDVDDFLREVQAAKARLSDRR